MKILHVITNLGVGGAERALYNLITQLQSKGHEHHVAFFYDGPIRQDLHTLGVTTYRLNALIHPYDGSCILHLLKLIKKVRPDILHTSLWLATVIGRIAGKISGIPVVSDLHGDPLHHGTLRRYIDKVTHKASHTIIPVSHSLAASYRNNVGAHPHIMVIQNGTYLPASIIKNDDIFTIGWVGRLEAIKNPFGIIEVAKQLVKMIPDDIWRIIIVGDGSMRGALEKTVKELGLEKKVLFTGIKQDLEPLYNSFSVLAITSHSEGLALALLEAMAHEVPVITTHEGPHDAINDGLNGYIVPYRDYETVAARIMVLMKAPEKVMQLSKAARKTIEQKFSITTCADSYEKLFLKLRTQKRM